MNNGSNQFKKQVQWNPETTILDITINILCPGKSCSKMYGTEPRYNDLRYNDILDKTVSFWRTERKIFPDRKMLQYQHTVQFKQNIER